MNIFTLISSKLKIISLDSLYSLLLELSKIIGIMVVAFVLAKVGSLVIRKLLEKQKGFKYGLSSKRLDTISSLSISIFRYAVYLIAIISILSDVFQLKSVLAAAGIGGIAVGFGAQSLIKDVISGFFIVFEGQFVVGDSITIDNMTGNVEEMGLRVTKLRNFNGDLYVIPNGEIKKVTNHTRGDKTVVVDIPISYGSDINKAIELAEKVCSEIEGEFTTIVEKPSVLGITELGKGCMNLRITGKTIPNEHFEVERRIRLHIKQEFSKENIRFGEKEYSGT